MLKKILSCANLYSCVQLFRLVQIGPSRSRAGCRCNLFQQCIWWAEILELLDVAYQNSLELIKALFTSLRSIKGISKGSIEKHFGDEFVAMQQGKNSLIDVS